MEALDYIRFVFALGAVLGFIGLGALAAKRLGFAPAARRAGQEARLSLVEVTPLDARRRLALIRRDGVEHLIILGPDHETVVETQIEPVAPRCATPAAPLSDLFEEDDARAPESATSTALPASESATASPAAGPLTPASVVGLISRVRGAFPAQRNGTSKPATPANEPAL